MHFELRYFKRRKNHPFEGVYKLIWYVFNEFFLASSIPGSLWRRLLLRSFGGCVGRGVVIKPRIRIKDPSKLKIGEYSWIGEAVWIDNIENVYIGSNVCISQGVYFCTGNHDYKSKEFKLSAKPILINDNCWVSAFTILGPGSVIGPNEIIKLSRNEEVLKVEL